MTKVWRKSIAVKFKAVEGLFAGGVYSDIEPGLPQESSGKTDPPSDLIAEMALEN